MPSKRKQIKSDLEALNRILSNYAYKKTKIIELSSDNDYNKATEYVQSMVNKLEADLKQAPIGHRYTGTFYVKRPYSIPYESVKLKGAAFMREDLISWVIESDDEDVKNLYYVRDVYKDKDMKVRIKREDGEAVFKVDN